MVAISGIYLSRYWKTKVGGRDRMRGRKRDKSSSIERETEAEREALEKNTCFTSRNGKEKKKKNPEQGNLKIGSFRW